MSKSHLTEFGIFLLRIALGIMFLAHSLFLKLFIFTLPGTAQFFISIGLPVLAGATWAHSGNGWKFGYENGGWEYPAYLTLLAIVQGLLGDGRFALSPSFAPGNVQMEGETT